MSFDPPKSRNEAILQNMLGANNVLPPPKGRVEELLLQILQQGGTGGGVTPEQIEAAVEAYLDENPIGIEPFEIPISDSGGAVTTTASAEDILAHADNLIVVYAGQKIDCSWHTASQFFFDWHDEVYPQFIGVAQFVVTIQNGAVLVTKTPYTSMSLPHTDEDSEPLTPGMFLRVNSQGVWAAQTVPSAESNSFGGGA